VLLVVTAWVLLLVEDAEELELACEEAGGVGCTTGKVCELEGAPDGGPNAGAELEENTRDEVLNTMLELELVCEVAAAT
jgi:hypothetical protein